jgi:hypothetical protein
MIIDRQSLLKITGSDLYDGSVIHTRFAYKFLRKAVVPTGSIIAFRAPMNVTTNLIDLEDSLNNDFIASEDAVNFCWEIPGVDPFGAVAFQRLFCTGVANILHQFIRVPIELKGDDFIVHAEHTQGGIVQPKGKASVSIACNRQGATLGHLGINITAGKKAPAFAYSTNLTGDQPLRFMHAVIEHFYEITHDMFVATTKVI